MTRRAEQSFQIEVARYLQLVLLPEVAWTAFPAGGGGKTRGAILKAMGLKSGWPDLILIYNGKMLGLELKTPIGKLSKAQKAMHSALEAAGAAIAICRCTEDIVATLQAGEVPMRRHTMYPTGAVRVYP